MNKRGQFYLIAAIIIATVMASVFVVFNYTEKVPGAKVTTLGKEIETESRNTIEYGMLQGFDESEFKNLMSNFADSYIDYTEKRKDLYFIFGTTNEIVVSGYQGSAREVTLIQETTTNIVTTTNGEFQATITSPSEEIILKIDNSQYPFTLKSGENFYFVINENLNGNEYVIKGDGSSVGNDLGSGGGPLPTGSAPQITSATINGVATGETITTTYGSPVTFASTATGDPTPTYFWNATVGEYTETILAQASGEMSDLATVTFSIDLTVTNTQGTDIEGNWILVINPAQTAPEIVNAWVHAIPPGGHITINVGNSLRLIAEVSGDEPITCEWVMGQQTFYGCDRWGQVLSVGEYTLTLTASNSAGISNPLTWTVSVVLP